MIKSRNNRPIKVLLGAVNQLTEKGQYFVKLGAELSGTPFAGSYECIPLGLLYIAAAQRKFGKTVCEYSLFDFHLGGESNVDTIFDNFEKTLTDFRPQVIALGCLTHNQINFLEQAITSAREYTKCYNPDAYIIVGGSPASVQPDRFLFKGADAVCIGEGEITFTEFIDCVAAGDSLENVNGLVISKNKTSNGLSHSSENFFIRTTSRPLITDLDTLPMPAWDLVDMKGYIKRSHGIFSPVLTQRGCPYDCFYCSHNRKFRAHSAKRVVDEFEILSKEYGAIRIDIVDEIFNCNENRVFEICDEKRRRNIKCELQDYDGLRADILKERTVDALKEMDFVACSVAIESGTKRVQELIRKRLNLNKALRAIEWLVDRKIFVNAFFMIGFPTEERDEIIATLKMARDCYAHMCTIAKVEAYPGTPMWNFAIEYGLNESKYDYKQAQRFGKRKDPGFMQITEDELHYLWKRGVWDVYNDPIRISRIYELFGLFFTKTKYKKFYKENRIWTGEFPKQFEKLIGQNPTAFNDLSKEAAKLFFRDNPEAADVF